MLFGLTLRLQMWCCPHPLDVVSKMQGTAAREDKQFGVKKPVSHTGSPLAEVSVGFLQMW